VMKVRVAVLQYDVPEDTDTSFKKLDELVGNAVWSAVKLVVAPETAVGNIKELTKETDYLKRLAEISQKHNIYLATSYYNLDKGKIYNQGVIIDPEGKNILSHKKIYLAIPEVEDKVIPGDKIETTQTDIGKLGMLVCKDGFNRYSHFLYDKLNDLGVEIICIPTWSLGWKEMDTQEYVKALYVYGSFASRAFILMSGNLNMSTKSFGRSLIISPVRGVLKEASKDHKEILVEELDLNEVSRTREFDSRWQSKRKVNI
jgi:predicted amidohydrolase